MPSVTQVNWPVRVYTIFGDDVLLFNAMSGSDRLGSLFNYELVLFAEDNTLDLDTLLGTGVTVAMDLPDGSIRHFHGHVARCGQDGSLNDFALYHVTLRPWFWFLTRTADCRIFQELSVPDIIRLVFDEELASAYDDRLTGTYDKWDFCVQYRETDFQFLSRLMEQVGIYYFFEHSDGEHRLVLCDDISAHQTADGYAEVPYFPPSGNAQRDRDHLDRWQVRKQVQPGRFVVNDFNFENPGNDLVATREQPFAHEHADYEMYDYPGEYPQKPVGERIAQYWQEASHTQHEVVSGGGDARGLSSGVTFSLTQSDRPDQDREYLVVESSYTIGLDDFSGQGGSGGLEFHTTLSAIDVQQPYRTPRTTVKPVVQGPQTATVVGPSGEEIWTDRYGRVKLQFHWDRYGQSDENSSCWVRVSQVWAGAGWGAMHIPRIGQEVIVEFLEGDPDRPIITGRVYNGDNAVPYGLPAKATQSGIKSRSSKSGTASNFNEIRMEDKKGSEELYVQAEKDQNNLVKNDESTRVGHDRSENVGNDETIEIGHDRSETVGNDETIAIGHDRQESVGNNETLSIGTDRTETVGSNERITIGKNRIESVGVDETLSIGSSRDLNVGKNHTETVGADKSTTVGKNETWTIGQNESWTIGKNRTIDVGESDTISIGKKLTIDVGDEITIRTGKASIVMKKDGSITLSGKDISIKASGELSQKASKNVVIKGKKVLQN